MTLPNKTRNYIFPSKNSLAKPDSVEAYLEPISGSMQKPIESYLAISAETTQTDVANSIGEGNALKETLTGLETPFHVVWTCTIYEGSNPLKDKTN